MQDVSFFPLNKSSDLNNIPEGGSLEKEEATFESEGMRYRGHRGSLSKGTYHPDTRQYPPDPRPSGGGRGVRRATDLGVSEDFFPPEMHVTPYEAPALRMQRSSLSGEEDPRIDKMERRLAEAVRHISSLQVPGAAAGAVGVHFGGGRGVQSFA